MRFNLRRKLYPLFAGFFALSLMLSACGGGSEDVVDPAMEEPALEEPAVEEPAGD